MTGKMKILALVGLMVFCGAGCGRREKAALRQKEEMIRILEEQIQSLKTEIASLQSSLAEKEGLTVELADLLRQAQSEAVAAAAVSPDKPEVVESAPEESEGVPARPTGSPTLAERKNPLGEAITQAISRQKTGSISPDEEIVFLRQENQRLLAELENLRALLVRVQETGVASAPAEPAVSAGFQNPQIAGLYESYIQSTSSAGRVEILQSLLEYAVGQDREVLPILELALDDPDPAVVQAGAGLLESYSLPEALSLIEKALHSRDEQTRLIALSPLEQIADPKAAQLACLALSDPSPEVRSQALEVIRGQQEDIQILSLSQAMGSVSDEVKSDVLSLLELRGDKPAVEVILVGLKDPNSEFQEEVKRVLQFLLDQEFTSYNEAMRWWRANRDRYDENLFEKQ